jgi:CHAD domain-containing protein
MATAARQGAALLARNRLCACIDGALAALLASEPDDAAVHGARRELKRARALLRLLRATLNPRVYRGADLLLRDAGRSLSQARDVAVLAAALERMRIAAGVSRQSVGGVVRALARERRAANLVQAARGARSALRLARLRLLRARLADGGEEPLVEGLVRIYRRGRRDFGGARAAPTADRLHAWRRQVKRYWHALEVLAPGRPRAIRALAREAHALADLLGEDHDLAMLATRLASARLAAAMRRRLRVAIVERRTRIEIDALALGAQLYAIRPRRCRKQAERWWRHWATAVRHERAKPRVPAT